jgi:hypothetical protein
MLPIADPRWLTLDGGYREVFDPRPALERAAAGDDTAWDELWNGLHHQSDVGQASYAAVPYIVAICRDQADLNWNPYAIISTIELYRRFNPNPPIAKWLNDVYNKAWRDVLIPACRDLLVATDETAVCSVLATVALAKHQNIHAKLILEYSSAELDELIASLRGE